MKLKRPRLLSFKGSIRDLSVSHFMSPQRGDPISTGGPRPRHETAQYPRAADLVELGTGRAGSGGNCVRTRSESCG
jgi:hypothetical protein